MTRSLYTKLLFGYLLFGLLGFITIATLSSRMTYYHLVKQNAEALYDEASLIAGNCSEVYEGKHLDLEAAYPQLEAVGTYLRSEIWIIEDNGTITAATTQKKSRIDH
ncbi:MAG: hypothetical protein ACI4OO_10750 [Otoolea sp.]